MNPSRETRHELYDFLKSLGFELDNLHRHKIRDFLINHTDLLIVELRTELNGLHRVIRNKNLEIEAYRSTLGRVHYNKELPPKVVKTPKLKKLEAVPMPAQKEELSSFAIPKSLRFVK